MGRGAGEIKTLLLPPAISSCVSTGMIRNMPDQLFKPQLSRNPACFLDFVDAPPLGTALWCSTSAAALGRDLVLCINGEQPRVMEINLETVLYCGLLPRGAAAAGRALVLAGRIPFAGFPTAGSTAAGIPTAGALGSGGANACSARRVTTGIND